MLACFKRTLFACLILVVSAAYAHAQPALSKSDKVFVQAQQMGYDQKNAIVVARGKVEVNQNGTILLADRLTYYQAQNVVRAEGNVVVSEPNGDTYFAEQVQLRDDMKRGVINNFRVRMVDNSQFAAREAKKVTETETQLTKAVYSPCKICKGEDPFWQIKAGEVEINEEDQRVYYEDLQLEMMGVPIMYTPYFFHPTPDTERKSGILKPTYEQDSNLGTVVRVPYYLNIAPDRDATLTPIFTSEEGIVFETEYRQRFENGQLNWQSSITYPEKRDDNGLQLTDNELRGHVFANLHDRFADNWAWGFDLQRSTDDTYLRKYDYGSQKSLNSRLFLEGNWGRSYASAQAMAFQGLQADDDPDTEPFVLPLLEGYYESDPGWQGSRYYSHAQAQVITRDEGAKSRRLSVTSGYKVPVVTSGGHLLDVDTRVRSDVVSAEDVTLSSGATFDGSKTRIMPQASLKWRYPLMKQVGDATLTIEPTVLAVAAPTGNNPEEIPNEDNLIVEYSDMELFAIDRFPGYDLVDEGSRIAYGVRSHLMLNERSDVHFLFGQNYSTEDETPYPYNDEPGEHFSDYVGRLALDYRPVSLSYRFRLDQHDLQPNTNNFTARYNERPVNAQLSYVSLDNDQFLSDREEVYGSLGLRLSDEWSVNAAARRDLLTDDMLFWGTGLTYQNDCFTLLTSFRKEFYRDRDFEPDTNFTVKVSFKNLNDL